MISYTESNSGAIKNGQFRDYTMIAFKNATNTAHNNGMFQLTSVLVLLDVVVIF